MSSYRDHCTGAVRVLFSYRSRGHGLQKKWDAAESAGRVFNWRS